jgi:hypothetical protein
MTGVTDLNVLLASMEPKLQPGEFLFCTIPRGQILAGDFVPLATFIEKEGRTLILEVSLAAFLDCPKSAPMRHISLTIHSSLEAVGLTAAISTELTRHRISANVVAAFYHDHIFVPSADAERAVEALRDLSTRSTAA